MKTPKSRICIAVLMAAIIFAGSYICQLNTSICANKMTCLFAFSLFTFALCFCKGVFAMSVGKTIRDLRKERGIRSQEELAYLLDTARQTVSSWERDICLPEGANLVKLANVLGTSVAHILGEDTARGRGQGPARPRKEKRYALNARSPEPFSISIERSENGKTVRYDLPPEDAEIFFPLVERLWKKIERKMESR
ncbi:hypothetical protein B5F39_07040 [Cloacibacillus sp. An23]|nr:hypothetical protein B5F39_07040 [Cloacibacillus sp. An23]